MSKLINNWGKTLLEQYSSTSKKTFDAIDHEIILQKLALRRIVGKSVFPEQFKKLINRYKRIRYGRYVVRQTACLIVGPASVGGCASFFGCTTAGRASMTAST